MFFDPLYFLFLAPAMLLAAWAQHRVQRSYARGMQVPAPMSGAQAARQILDDAGCGAVEIEETQGFLSDHYDPQHRVLRLSSEVFHSHSATAVGIAAHEAGHALQHAQHYLPLVVRNAAVPAAQWGPTLSIGLLILGFLIGSLQLVWFGIFAYCGLLAFQLINLPVEFDASRRARQLLAEMRFFEGAASYGDVAGGRWGQPRAGCAGQRRAAAVWGNFGGGSWAGEPQMAGPVDPQEAALAVRDVLSAAAWTYVAGTLQTLLTVLYYVFRATQMQRDD